MVIDTPPCHPVVMTDQLVLIDPRPTDRPLDWRLDERTRDLGRRGVQEAREALARFRPKAAALSPHR